MNRPIRFRGDEIDRYGEFNHELVKELMRDARFTREIAEDASAEAWIEFFHAQPDRHEGRWRRWLFERAEREAARLVDSQCADRGSAHTDVADPRDRQAERLEFQAAVQELHRLPPRVRQAVVISSQLAKHADVAEVVGVSRQRVAHLLATAVSKWRVAATRAEPVGTRHCRVGPPRCAISRTRRLRG
jgi:hypothetical protein